MGRLSDTIELVKQKFGYGEDYNKNYLPMEGHKFVSGTGIQAPIGSELLKNSPQKQYSNPTPTPTPQQQYSQNINVPSDTQGGYQVDPQIAQYLMDVYDPINKATESATTLHHRTGPTLGSVRYGQNENRGENPGFETSPGWVNEQTGEKGDYNYDESGELKHITNPFTGKKEPSEDRGLFRINNGTFYMLQNAKDWKNKLKEVGIESYEDMYDPYKNIKMSKIIGDFYVSKGLPRWSAWFATPIELVENNDLAQN